MLAGELGRGFLTQDRAQTQEEIRNSGLTAVGNVVVEVEHGEPGVHVGTRGGGPTDQLDEELEGIDIAIRPAVVLVGRPLLDLPSLALARAVFLDPGEISPSPLPALSCAMRASASIPAKRVKCWSSGQL